MKKLIFFVMLLPLLLATAGLAAVPHVFNYQGYLSDLDGYPLEGNFNLVFRIYVVGAGPDPALWTETHTLVPVVDGVFSVLLGSLVDLPPAVLAEDELWVGVTVGADDEINPRLQVTSTPWAYRAAIADSSVTTGSGGGEGGTVYRVNTGSGLTGGPITTTGTISVLSGGITNTHLSGNCVTSNKIVDGTIIGPDIANGTITSDDIANGTITAADIGTGAVASNEILNNSVTDLDILDEPGLSQNEGHPNNLLTLTSSGQSFLAVSINVPTPGFVMVTGQAGVFIRHTNGSMDNVIFKLSTIAGDVTTPSTGASVIRVPGTWPTDSQYAVHQMSMSLAFPVSAGTSTFHLNAYESSGTGDDKLLKPNLIAVFYPTSYGSVASAAAGSSRGPDVTRAE